MNEEDLRQMAGRALGLNAADMRFFNPLFCDRQTLEVAKCLLLNVYIDSTNKQTEITRFEPDSGIEFALAVELHASHNNNLSQAMRYGVLRAAAHLGMTVEVVVADVVAIASVPAKVRKVKQTCFKHGKRTIPLKAPTAASA